MVWFIDKSCEDIIDTHIYLRPGLHPTGFVTLLLILGKFFCWLFGIGKTSLTETSILCMSG